MYRFFYPVNHNLLHVLHIIKPQIFWLDKSSANTILVILHRTCEYVIVCDDDIIILYYLYYLVFSKTLTGLSVE